MNIPTPKMRRFGRSHTSRDMRQDSLQLLQNANNGIIHGECHEHTKKACWLVAQTHGGLVSHKLRPNFEWPARHTLPIWRIIRGLTQVIRPM